MTQARDLADGKFDTSTLVVDAANNRVGIGTTSPDRSLHITSSEPSVVLENSGQGTDLKTWRMYSNSSSLQIGTVDDAFAAGQNALEVTRDNTDNITGIQFKTGASSEIGRFTTDGLTFNGDTAAANALDDYEEGTFTPVAIGETTAGSGTYLYQVGEYVKIGKLVHFQISIQWSSHSGSGALRIQSLPFTSDSTTNNFASISAYISELPVTSNHRTMPFIRPNVSYININQASGSGGPSSVGIDAAAQVLVSGSYLSA